MRARSCFRSCNFFKLKDVANANLKKLLKIGFYYEAGLRAIELEVGHGIQGYWSRYGQHIAYGRTCFS